MKEYFIVENGEKKGAFSLKDLKSQTVLPDTLIWKEGWTDWKKAKDAVSDVPAIELIINDTPPVPLREPKKPKPKQSLLGNIAKASGGNLGALGSLVGIGGKEEAEDEEEKTAVEEERPSYTALFYSFVGQKIDKYLADNKAEIGSNALVTNLDKVRTYYKGLGINRQRSFSFLLSAFIFSFLVSLMAIGDSSMSMHRAFFGMTVFYSAFVALNQIKIVGDSINKIVGFIFLLDFGLTPEILKTMIARTVKFILFVIIAFYATYYIGLPYLIYRIVIAFVNPDKLPDFENR